MKTLSSLAIAFLFGYHLHWIGASLNDGKSIFDDTPNRQENMIYMNNNINLPAAKQCTQEQRDKIYTQLGLTQGKVDAKCQNDNWLEAYFEEQEDIYLESFLGISVGCNKGDDAVRTARMGLMDSTFDISSYKEALGKLPTACDKGTGQVQINFPKRYGEMHCIEPMPNNYKAIKNATESIGLGHNFVVTQAAISSTNGMVRFPDTEAGQEANSIDSCDVKEKDNDECVDVNMYSLDSYVSQFVKGTGPVNVLQIDVEGFDFDVLFGGSNVLDRTHYLEFEYHEVGNWGNLHIQDSVRLLNGKGFTCYWSSSSNLWRITGCYFDVYDYLSDYVYDNFHYWANVVCLHRSQTNLARRMEKVFLSTLANSVLDKWCEYCTLESGKRCGLHLSWLMDHYKLTEETQVMIDIMEKGYCIKPLNHTAAVI